MATRRCKIDLSYDLLDALGSEGQLTDGAGTLILTRSYTPWGELLRQQGSGDVLWGYFGGQHDSSTGLIYMGSGQYYDPETGRLLSPAKDGFDPSHPRNPYLPQSYDPAALMMAPLLLFLMLSQLRKRRKKGNWIFLLTLGIALSLGIAACGPPDDYESEPPRPPSPLPDTDIIDMPWVDEMDSQTWAQYPNSCGTMALYMFLKAEGKNVTMPMLSQQLSQVRPGGYDGYCCFDSIGGAPDPTPDPDGWCNEACVSAETLADVARQFYGMAIESGDNWIRVRVHQKLQNGHPVLVLVRVDLAPRPPAFGHFIVTRGMVDSGSTVVFNDSYPGNQYWESSTEERRKAGQGRREDWYTFDRSWASHVDRGLDPLAPEGHVRWAMAAK